MFCLHVCIVLHVCLVASEVRIRHPQKLELRMVMSHHVGAGSNARAASAISPAQTGLWMGWSVGHETVAFVYHPK